MRAWISSGFVIGVLNIGAVHAQTIEESYANLCSDKTAAKSETCAALRQALIAKLQEQSKTAPPAASLAPKTQPLPGAEAPAAVTASAPELAPEAPNAEASALWHKRWGFYADMVGKTWESASALGYLSTYRWKIPGEELETTTVTPDRKTVVKQSLVWDEARQVVVSRYQDFETYIVVQPDGSIESTGKPGTLTAQYRSVSRQRPDGAVVSESYQLKDGAWTLFTRNLHAVHQPGVTPPKPDGPPTELDKQLAEIQRQSAAPVQAQGEEEAGRSATKGKRGRILGTLLIAGVGATAASKFGGNTEQIVGGALKGAQIANADNSVGAALGSTADTMLTSGGNASGGAANGGAGTTAPGSYPTQPNLATGSCAGFTESNYREKAVSGGGDQQLYTMCGQAFEYYTMYKRAIAQGYSQADAERTYDAHRQAASTASSFLSSHAAN